MKYQAGAAKRLQAIATQIGRHVAKEGETVTAVPGLKLFRVSKTESVEHGMLRRTFCVVVQGEKVVRAGANTEGWPHVRTEPEAG